MLSLMNYVLLKYGQCGLSENSTLTLGDRGGRLTEREKPSASVESITSIRFFETDDTQMIYGMNESNLHETVDLKAKWPSYQERNLEARVKLAAKEEQHMTVETRKDTECIE
jgi:hypothetical protein